MAVCKLTMKDFSAFRNAALTFSPGLNVLIGANATGKSHLMKLIYSILKIKTPGVQMGEADQATTEDRLRAKLQRVFLPDKNRIGRLVTRKRGPDSASVALNWGGAEFAFTLSAVDRLTIQRDTLSTIPNCLFLPTRELLSMYPGFIAAYQHRELAFDETYYDLSVALNANPLRGARLAAAAALLKPLEQAMVKKVVLKGDQFYLQAKGEGMLEASLTAEGLRKIGSVMHLIANGSIDKAGVLFWDEPETNLNPKLITVVARLLLKLAGAGIQLFVATHDYLLTNELSLAAEYGTPEGKAAAPRFFCLTRASLRAPVEVVCGETVSELAVNPILEEFAAHYDRQQSLFVSARSIEE